MDALRIHSILGAIATTNLQVTARAVVAANSDPTKVYRDHALLAIETQERQLAELREALTDAPKGCPARAGNVVELAVAS